MTKEELEKLLKILKDKKVDLYHFINLQYYGLARYNRKTYNYCHPTGKLTQDEFNIIKRWLRNKQ